MRNRASLIAFVILLLCAGLLRAEAQLSVSSNNNVKDHLFSIKSLEGETASEVLIREGWEKCNSANPNFGVGVDPVFLKLSLNNPSSNGFIEISYPILDLVEVSFFRDGALIKHSKAGHSLKYSEREIDNPNMQFEIPEGSSTAIIRVETAGQAIVPVAVFMKDNMLKMNHRRDVWFGLYVGIFFVMFLYNLFLFFFIKDNSYLFYILYILAVCMTQVVLKGYGHRVLWPENNFLTTNSLYFFGALSGMAVILFVRAFLKTKEITPRFHTALKVFFGLYVISIIVGLAGQFSLSLNIINLTAGLGSLTLLAAAIQVFRRGIKSARYFVLAWSIFLVAVIIFVIKDYGLIPFNSFTKNVLEIGSSIEVVLLSVALADRINVLQSESRISKENELKALRENEKIIAQQKETLEIEVAEATKELQKSNEELEVTLSDLKLAQTHLVNNEKMVSLGQLTAGIAHEINNPINFVAGNINPLRRDVSEVFEAVEKAEELLNESAAEPQKEAFQEIKSELDLEYLKIEIDNLMNGIEDGANRTAEIVQGLRNFSRLDEADSKFADVHQGIESTLVILKSIIGPDIRIIKEFDSEIPSIECYPGKLNQVFSNLLTNSIQAIKASDTAEGTIRIETKDAGENIQIHIRDNGIGIPQDAKDKIFEPFFTTKEVGEGTGLGLSIVHTIIESHGGEISLVDTSPSGVHFLIELPKRLNASHD